jgi:hypothetical protein
LGAIGEETIHKLTSKLKFSAAALAFASAFAAPAARASERMSAAHCFIDPEFTSTYRWQDGIANLSSGLAWTPLRATCPITVDDTNFDKSRINQVFVSFVDGNNQFGAIHNFHVNVCMVPWGGTLTPVCFGDRELNPGTATGAFWTAIPSDMTTFLATQNPFHFANLVVMIPANNGWPSVLRGVEVFR